MSTNPNSAIPPKSTCKRNYEKTLLEMWNFYSKMNNLWVRFGLKMKKKKEKIKRLVRHGVREDKNREGGVIG